MTGCDHEATEIPPVELDAGKGATIAIFALPTDYSNVLRFAHQGAGIAPRRLPPLPFEGAPRV